jgi:hypothetical protein
MLQASEASARETRRLQEQLDTAQRARTQVGIY